MHTCSTGLHTFVYSKCVYSSILIHSHTHTHTHTHTLVCLMRATSPPLVFHVHTHTHCHMYMHTYSFRHAEYMFTCMFSVLSPKAVQVWVQGTQAGRQADTHTHTHTHTHTRVCVHMHTHTHKHTLTHTCIPVFLGFTEQVASFS